MYWEYSIGSSQLRHSIDGDGPWTRELVDEGLKHLRNPAWKIQKAGVTILSALAQTGMDQPPSRNSSLTFSVTPEHGVAAIGPQLYGIIEMLLPRDYLLIQPTTPQATPANQTPPDEGQAQPAATTAVSTDSTSLHDPSKPPSWMMGPACALRILVQNSKCYPRSYGDVGTDVMCYFRDTAGPYASDGAIQQFETFVSVWNARRQDRHVAMAHQHSKPK